MSTSDPTIGNYYMITAYLSICFLLKLIVSHMSVRHIWANEKGGGQLKTLLFVLVSSLDVHLALTLVLQSRLEAPTSNYCQKVNKKLSFYYPQQFIHCTFYPAEA